MKNSKCLTGNHLVYTLTLFPCVHPYVRHAYFILVAQARREEEADNQKSPTEELITFV